jgi:phosphatidylinositol alpha-mannosyltransferase
MRIALVTEFYYPHLGGVTEHVHNLALQFRKLGHEALVVTSKMGDGRGDESFVRRVGASRVFYSNGSFCRVTTGWGLGKKIEAILREEAIDVVHLHGALAPVLGMAVLPVARRLRIPVVATFHSWFPRSPFYRVFKRKFQKDLDGIAAKIAVSEPVVEALSRYFRSTWQVIPNGVNVGYFHPNGRVPTDALRRGPRLLFLGRLDPRNGLDTILAAMPMILPHHPRARLIVAGDGPLRRYYERKAAPLGDSVRFLGHVFDERPEHYGSSDIYVCPTTRASFGITLLEAMACGTPMIVSDIIGFRELVDGGAEAVLVPANRPDAWARAAVELIDDPARRESMGAAGLVKAERFAWPNIAKQVLGVYERVVG